MLLGSLFITTTHSLDSLPRRSRAYIVKPINITSAGSNTASRCPTHAESPTAPNNITNAGVKQQSAAIIVPAIPVFNNVDFFTSTPYFKNRVTKTVKSKVKLRHYPATIARLISLAGNPLQYTLFYLANTSMPPKQSKQM